MELTVRNERDPEEHSANPIPEECDHDTRAHSRSRSSADSPAITMVFSCAHIYPFIGYVCKNSHLAGTATFPSPHRPLLENICRIPNEKKNLLCSVKEGKKIRPNNSNLGSTANHDQPDGSLSQLNGHAKHVLK